MDISVELFVQQCIFCMKDADECNLIEMNSNSMLISSVNVEFSTIVYDVVNRKISDLQHNYICEDCNEIMIQCYVFKENAKNNEYLLCDKKKTDVLKELESFLEECGQEDIQIMNRGKCIAMFPESERKVMKDFQSWQLKTYVEHTNTAIPPPPQRKRKIEEVNVDEDKDTQLSYENNDSMGSDEFEFENVSVKSDHVYTDEHELNFEEYEDPETPKKESQELFLFQEPESKKIKIVRKSSDSDYSLPVKVNTKENVLIKKETRKKLVITSDGEQKSRFTCQSCNYSCFNMDTLKKHIKVIHMNDPNREKTIMKSKYSCDPCWLKFRDQINYDIHLKCHQLFEVIAPIVELPKCDECRCLFVNDVDLGIHLSRHDDPELLFEPILSEGTAMNARFVMEILMPEDEIEIDDEIAWKCGHCTRKFSDEVECRKHQLIFHARRFVCPIDNREFFRLPTHAFSQHLKKCHPELFPDIPIDCTYCHLVFTTIYDKLAHMKNCDEKKFVCHVCGNKFFKNAELLKHEKIHTGNTGYNCEICGKMAVNKQSLDTHMLSHTNETPYKCSLCPKAYKTSSARASHMEVHNETDLECSFCSVKFKKRAILQRHVKNYHDEKYREEKFRELTCSFCKKAFLKRERYHHHMKNNHNVLIGEETIEEVTDYSE